MSFKEFENLEEEVKELLMNYKHKKATSYEPCTIRNIKECLIGLSEEFRYYNVKYIFNPHTDMDNNTLESEALVTLLNAVWSILHQYKLVSNKEEKLSEDNHALIHNNKQLNGMLCNLKEKLNSEKNEARACVASAQRAADRCEETVRSLSGARSKLSQLTKQKENVENSLRHEIARLKLQNDKLQDRLRSKSGVYSGCDTTLRQLREREQKQRAVISQLQCSNRELIREVLAVKEHYILEGLDQLQLPDKHKTI